MKNSLFILCSMVVFMSCKKDLIPKFTDDEPIESHPADLSRLAKKVVSIRPAGRDTTVTTYQYDSHGRTLRVTSKSVDDKYSYTNGYYMIDGKYEDKIFKIVGNKIDSLITFSPNDTTAEKYVRDGQQQLIMTKRYYLQGTKSKLLYTTTNTYENGSISKSVNSDGTSTTFTYTNTPYEDNTGNIYAFTNKYLTDTETYAGSPIRGTYYYSYQFDAQGRVVRKTFRGSFSVGTLLEETYTY